MVVLTMEKIFKKIAIFLFHVEFILPMLIDGLNYTALNRIIDPKITAARLTCHQTCAIPDGACSLCYRVLAMAKKDFIQSYTKQASKEE